MVKIESLRDYINNNDEFVELVSKIYDFTSFIINDYPNYKNWYFNKVLPDIINNERDILFTRNPNNYNEIISMLCLKNSNEEKKICTLYVSDKYRNLGIGSSLIMEAMNILDTSKPFITIMDYKLDVFKPIINKFNWKLTEVIPSLYNNSCEFCFNGNEEKILKR